ncbi:MAG: ATP-binding protein, partial [Sphaerochaetaceae bacterium]|nr:ATP-binding protein [Sphaerochaetaceae bacterium]
MKYFYRHTEINIKDSQNTFPAILVTGPRQVGKSTTLRKIYSNLKTISLDSQVIRIAAQEDPRGFLEICGNPLILDEIQKVPILFDEIKAIIDSNRKNGMFFLTGSQSFKLMEHVTESLSGRVSIITMLGLSTREIYSDTVTLPFLPTKNILLKRSPNYRFTNKKLWERIHRGSFPELWANPSLNWDKFYSSYVQTYLERDIRDLGQVGNLDTFRKFMTSVAARTAQMLNMASIAKDVGVDQTTIKRWLSILEASHIIELVYPFSTNITKRIIKAPKLYFTDSGLVSYLTRWTSPETLEAGAMSGQIFETYVFSELVKSYINCGKTLDLYYYRDTNGAEVDFL